MPFTTRTVLHLAQSAFLTSVLRAIEVGFFVWLACVWTPMCICCGPSAAALLTAPGTALIPLLASFFNKDRILCRAFPNVACPQCDKEIGLVERWACGCGAPPRQPRHAISRCTFCGSGFSAIECGHCRKTIVFQHVYPQLSMCSRNTQYSVHTNPMRTVAVLSCGQFLLYAGACLDPERPVGTSIFLVLAAMALAAIHCIPPKILTPNPTFKETQHAKR